MKTRKLYGTTGLKLTAAIPLIALLFLMIGDTAKAAVPPDIKHTSTGFGNAKQVYTTNGTHTWTVPEGVSQVKITSVGGGGGAYHNIDSGTLSGGGGGVVVENLLLSVSSGSSLSIVVGEAGSSSSSASTSGGASYVTYNGTRYAYASGGNPGTASGSGAGGGSGGGRGGYINNKSIVYQAASGRYGAAGQTTTFNYDDRTYYSVGGGGSWGDGRSYILQGSAPVALPSNYAYGSGGIVSLGYGGLSTKSRSYSGGVGAIAISYIISPVSITLNHPSISLSPGSSQALTATVYPSNADDKSYTWSSDKPEVAAVNSSGLVTAKANGAAIITAKTTDGGITASCTVTVTTPASGVTVTPESVVMNKGETKQLSAVVAPSSATNKSVTWTSDNPDVASVNSSGLVTAVSDGTAVITAKTSSGGYTDTCKVTVKTPVSGISISSSSIELNKGETQQLTATVTPPDATNKKVVWSSTDDEVAAVSQDGTVTAAGGGTAVVTATTEDGSYSAKCSVVVSVPVTGIQFNDTSSSVGIGNETRLGYTITPPDATNKTVTWQSSDTAVAWIDETTGVITPISPGGAEITATTEDGSFTVTTLLVVTNTLNFVRLKLVTESGEYPAFGTVHFTSAGNVIEYPGTMIGGNGEMDASIPSSPSSRVLGVSLLNTLISGMTIEADAEDVSSTPLYMVEGDFNSDNVIDGADWALLVQRKLYGGGETQYGLVGDMNYDSAVDDLDLLLFNSPVTHTGAQRFMSRGYAIHDAKDGEPPEGNVLAPDKSIIAIDKIEDGRYEVSLNEPSGLVNVFQLSLDGNISDASYSAPDGFKLLGSHIEDGRTVVAIGTDKEGGDTIPSGEPFVTVAAPDTPCVKYGVNDTTMLLAAEEGVEAVSMESGKNAADTDSAISSGGSSGCNAGAADAGLFAVVPLAIFRSFKSFKRRNSK